jgi:pimeloyl-ACP methyl ester carboxylesterase
MSATTEQPEPPALLLIHGLGATAGVWADLVSHIQASDRPWPGPIVTAELPGHGAAPWTGDYTVGSLAAAVSAQCRPGASVVALGHSLGGGVALALASGFFRPRVRAVLGLGVKVAWTEADVAGMAKVAAKGVRWFDSADEATDRFLLQAGLADVADRGHPATEQAIAAGTGPDDGRWRVASGPGSSNLRPERPRHARPDGRGPMPGGVGGRRARCDGVGR